MQRRAFVIRVWLNDDNQVIGQLSDLLEGRRQPFRSAAELWELLNRRVADGPAAPPAATATILTNEGE